MLKVVTASVQALTDDGRLVAITERRTLDNAETDNYRYGDPTFIAPAAVRFVVIDTETGQRSLPLGDRLVNLRQAEFSRDGKRLAVIVASAGTKTTAPVVSVMAGPATGPLSAVAVKSTNLIAANSSLDWTLDGSRVVVSMRTPAREQEAAAKFKALTEGPIVVQSSKNPFLDWDALSRENRWRSVAEIDVTTGVVTERVPERKLSSFQLTRDQTTLVMQEDVTEKTDYDVIGGTENQILALTRGDAQPKTILPAKDAKGLDAPVDRRRPHVLVCEAGRSVRAEPRRDGSEEPDAEAETRGRRQARRRRHAGSEARHHAGREEGNRDDRVVLRRRVQPRRVQAHRHEQQGLVRRQRGRRHAQADSHARQGRGEEPAGERARLGAGRLGDLCELGRTRQVGARHRQDRRDLGPDDDAREGRAAVQQRPDVTRRPAVRALGLRRRPAGGSVRHRRVVLDHQADHQSQSVAGRARRAQVGAREVSRRRRQGALRRPAVPDQLRSAARRCPSSSSCTRRSSTTDSTRARCFSATAATRCSCRR